jgi:hypothetical protein
MKLQQDQVWKRGEEYLRILHLERLEVEYKSVKSLTTRAGTRHHVSKKDFCRLLKTAHLMTLEEIQKSWYQERPVQKRLILVGAEVTRLKFLREYRFI